jgi:hypothetical protein
VKTSSLLLAATLLLPACNSSGKQPAASLSGKVILNGQPLTVGTLMVAGPHNEEASAQIREDGSFQILNPPKGALKFKIFMMPAPPGRPAPTASHGQPAIPEKYVVYDNELNCDYSGGRQTFDVVMKN